MARPVLVSQIDGVPVVSLPDHRAFESSRQLCEAIEEQAEQFLLKATTEDLARAVGAAMFLAEYLERPDVRPFTEALRSLMQVGPEARGSEAIERLTHVVDAGIWPDVADRPKPTIGQSTDSGIDMAVNGARAIMEGSSGGDDFWKPNTEMLDAFAAHVERDYPDPRHPIRRAFTALMARVG